MVLTVVWVRSNGRFETSVEYEPPQPVELVDDYVQSAGWNMDALFIPQDHPAREVHGHRAVPLPYEHAFTAC